MARFHVSQACLLVFKINTSVWRYAIVSNLLQNYKSVWQDSLALRALSCVQGELCNVRIAKRNILTSIMLLWLRTRMSRFAWHRFNWHLMLWLYILDYYYHNMCLIVPQLHSCCRPQHKTIPMCPQARSGLSSGWGICIWLFRWTTLVQCLSWLHPFINKALLSVFWPNLKYCCLKKIKKQI